MQLSLVQLLEVENDPALLGYRCQGSGVLIWPLIRNQFLRQLISDLYYSQAPLLAPMPPIPRRQALGAMSRAVTHNIRQGRMEGDVLVVATGAGHFQRNGLWFNRIADYLVKESPVNTVTVEGVMDWHLPYPRWNQRVDYWLPWQGAINLAGRLLKQDKHVLRARELLEYVRERAEKIYGLKIASSDMNILIGMLARKLARLPIVMHAYRRLLEKVKPRLLLLEQACYGDFAPFNQIAREMGVRVAEPQHGMVSGGHDAYCYAPLLRDSQIYRTCLPHDFLAYGSWWCQQINAPVQKWVIGNPHYSAQQREFSPLGGAQQTDILLLGDGVEFSLYLTLAQELASRLKRRYRIVLRPHPLERADVLSKFPEGRAGEVMIDANRDIYSSFSRAYAVVGEVSTGLFEAQGIAGRVLIWETPKARFSYPQHPFRGFVDAQGLVDVLDDAQGGNSGFSKNDIWAPDWTANFHQYLDMALLKPAI